MEKSLKEYEETWKVIGKQYSNHFTEKGWTKTRFELYHNQKANSNRNMIPWKLDEPVQEADYKALFYFFNLGKWAFQGSKSKNLQVVTRVDIGHWNCDKFLTPNNHATKCYKSKDYNKYNADIYLKPTVDHWVISSSHASGAQHFLKNYERKGVKLMTYNTAGTKEEISGNYTKFAGLGYVSSRMGVVGIINYRLGLAQADPNDVPKRCLMYNGKSMGFDGILASRRLKIWGNAVNDFDYITAAKKKNSAKTDLLNYLSYNPASTKY